MAPRRARSLLVTGASGYLGRLLLRRVAASPDPPTTLVALDLRTLPESERLAGVHYGEGDVGSPLVKSAKVKAKVVQTAKGKKISVIKFKRRKNYLRNKGHRQWFTEVEVTGITGAPRAKKAEAGDEAE